MFQAIVRRAQLAVDHTIDRAVNSAIMSIPFIIAAGFGTAALTLRLQREFGTEMATFLMAIIFAVVGAIIVAYVELRPKSEPSFAAVMEADSNASAPSPASSDGEYGVSAEDREMLMSAAGAIAPALMPQFLHLIMRNLPLLAILAVAIFVALQDRGEDEAATASSST